MWLYKFINKTFLIILILASNIILAQDSFPLTNNTDLKKTKNVTTVPNPPANENYQPGKIAGHVFDSDTKEPLIGTNIVAVGMNNGAATNENGYYLISDLKPGKYTLEFSYIGYQTLQIDHVIVKENEEVNIEIELQPEALQLKNIIVTPGRFSIMGKEPVVRQTLTREDLQTITFGEDIYRAITRLPGVVANDFSAKFTVRGGENDEILVLMDGMELYEPFHLKDVDGGALSIIDSDIIEGIDLFTGGFPVEYLSCAGAQYNLPDP